MPKRRKSLSIDKCRICLCENGVMTDIFANELRGRIKEFTDSTSINIKDIHGYPRNICHVCLYKVDMWCDFKAQFIQTNEILMQHLQNAELSDHTVPPAKRKQSESQPSQPSQEENHPESQDKCKSKPEMPALVPLASVNAEKSAERPQNADAVKNLPDTPQIGMDSTSEGHSQHQMSSVPKTRQSGNRRTTEQRMASTQRWEARKKALLAATGENDSDTDSMASDDNQLSPIQKARAKNIAEKEAERQKRLGKAVNNLGNLGGSQIDPHPIQNSESNSQEKLSDKNEEFQPQSVQSEVVIGDTTYIVTSTLLLTDPHANQNQVNHQTKEKAPEDATQYQNTDIMDAVKLKRVNPPKSSPQNDKKYIERCLNIEVEGKELETLQKVQAELANFIETDMKQKLTSNEPVEEKVEQKPQDSTQALETKLKDIIERAIKNNIENSRMRRVPISKIATTNRGNKTFSSAFIKAATKSPLFQPKVQLNRVEVVPHKEIFIPTESAKKLDNATIKNSVNLLNSVTEETKLLVTPSPRTYPVKSSHNPNILRHPRPDPTSDQSSKPDAVDTEKHICGFCGANFSSKQQVEAHYEIHRSESTANQVKQKLMRCKRCHEIVEARFVKTHICKSSKYKCEICNALFKTQMSLERHSKVHKDEVKIERMPNVVEKVDLPETAAVSKAEELKTRVYTCFICDTNFTDEEILKDHLQKHCEEVSEEEHTRDEKSLYQCAICGETLDSESNLENHVEKHLFDDEDDNPDLINIEGIVQVQAESNLHTCVQCSKEFETELNLVMHMQAHEEEAAFAEWEKQGLKLQDNHACTICNETFDSEDTLADHLDIHNGSYHICELCDRPFVTLVELQEHVETHCT